MIPVSLLLHEEKILIFAFEFQLKIFFHLSMFASNMSQLSMKDNYPKFMMLFPEYMYFRLSWGSGYDHTICYVLTFDPAQKNAIPRWCTGRKWHIPMASNRKRSRGRIKAYNMGQGEGPTLPIHWCTGREWPLNCMTVISAWWRLNIRFQRSSRRSCGRWIII